MNQPNNIYISLGSNKGDKFKNLQNAIDLIHQKIGFVLHISRVYKTEAIGFEGDDFFNACISVETNIKPKKAMQFLLSVEKELGRTRNQTKGYD